MGNIPETNRVRLFSGGEGEGWAGAWFTSNVMRGSIASVLITVVAWCGAVRCGTVQYERRRQSGMDKASLAGWVAGLRACWGLGGRVQVAAYN